MPARKRPSKPELPERSFATALAFSAWLAKNHAESPGLWLKIAKKASGVRSVDYPSAVEVALCWGWIDGQCRSCDETWYLQRFTPRSPRSIWSKINRVKVLALIEAGKMQPSGLAEIERAQQDGRWDRAYDSPKTATVPDDLAAALASNSAAAELFAKLDATNRYAILHRIQTAKKPETRARRIEQFVAMLADGRKLY